MEADRILRLQTAVGFRSVGEVQEVGKMGEGHGGFGKMRTN